MNEETFQRKLVDLIAEIATKNSPDIQEIAEQIKARHTVLKATVGSLQESIDFVRLSIKYMLFDLEATRRENAQLRRMLDDAPDGPGDGH